MKLTLDDFSDQDLMYALEDSGDDEGWATSREIMETIGMEETEKEKPTRNISIRLSWLNRFGVMEQHKVDGKFIRPMEWRLNEVGYQLLHPTKLSAASRLALESLDEGQRVLATELVAKQLNGTTSRQAMHMATRRFRHSTGTWRDAAIAPKRKAA